MVVDTTKALLVIDMVKGFLNEKTNAGPCAMYLKDAKAALVPNILREFKALGNEDIVVYLCDAHARGDADFKQFPPHCIEGTEESEVVDELPTEEDNDLTDALCYRLNKTRFSGFVKTELEGMLSHFEVEELLITGLVTELCVAETVKSARQLDFPVTIIKDCIWPLDRVEGDKVLAALQKNYGVRVSGGTVDVTSGGPPASIKEMNVSPPASKTVEAPKPVEAPKEAPKEATTPPRAGPEKK